MIHFENQTKLDKLNMKHREMIQELKDKEFQLKCIQQLLTNSICNEVIRVQTFCAQDLVARPQTTILKSLFSLFWIGVKTMVSTSGSEYENLLKLICSPGRHLFDEP